MSLTSCFVIFNDQFTLVELGSHGYRVYVSIQVQQIISRHRERGDSHVYTSVIIALWRKLAHLDHSIFLLHCLPASSKTIEIKCRTKLVGRNQVYLIPCKNIKGFLDSCGPAHNWKAT